MITERSTMPDDDIDAAPHATPDQVRAALKRRDAARAADGVLGRTSAPEARHAPEAETAAPAKRAAKKATKGRG